MDEFPWAELVVSFLAIGWSLGIVETNIKRALPINAIVPLLAVNILLLVAWVVGVYQHFNMELLLVVAGLYALSCLSIIVYNFQREKRNNLLIAIWLVNAILNGWFFFVILSGF
ncbi:hypothetical protein A3K34_02290 [candidate division WWE3 bacterium RIFOXYC1_FULL_40_10]|uniref:Uncharacterized protein n=1 Tax=candidate division WWE3 bacterium RIFOXYA2_FULL_46_9 TaxID=1802636 RepID=A0A1F4VYU3_UNCKA|nr:MAG: hypothetical protein A3K58_02290 [candidate division WWE3 bacterium RIFOXYB1_FULL_40_22]OGC61683.1 MAG: hypothetical protein A3K37_02290 [candidate division WWE3 bacterium RIFOXYA1_FULL_40_11]OGC62332.1 MAG: hypothetical protein A2264_02080 [candidate division WWE3 bacterium RIFOXYA2_FULL_46_9]OGC64858.1 MAG: hypothetical protein A2326_01115 [candidate division WWE3 bacterium RIFOXYB2_FULL_41_6]OGC66066.1 MAG: hypothetical protein A3K34_02290 [candidate division WWE3 bacterium RIFOXYC1_